MTPPTCDQCTHLNTKSFDDEVVRMCRLSARLASLERDHVIEHQRRSMRPAMARKCGPKGINFLARAGT